MSDIRITPRAQVMALVGALAVIVAAVVAQLPELRRYLKIESM